MLWKRFYTSTFVVHLLENTRNRLENPYIEYLLFFSRKMNRKSIEQLFGVEGGGQTLVVNGKICQCSQGSWSRNCARASRSSKLQTHLKQFGKGLQFPKWNIIKTNQLVPTRPTLQVSSPMSSPLPLSITDEAKKTL